MAVPVTFLRIVAETWDYTETDWDKTREEVIQLLLR
jgi:hypothetical protein